MRNILAKVIIVGLLPALAACGAPSAEDARASAVAKCERQFGRMAPDPSKGGELCSCMVDELAGAGLEVTDMLGSERSKVEQITRSCAKKAGFQLPSR